MQTMMNSARVKGFGRGAVMMRSRSDRPLDLEDIRAQAPAVFAEAPHASRSQRFVPVPTGIVLEAMAAEGFHPYSVVQAGSGDEGKRAFTKHMIRLRHASAPTARELGDVIPEIVLLNANDGSAAFSLFAGLFRLVCTNGLIVGAGQFAGIHVRHGGRAEDVAGKVIEGSYEIVNQSPAAIDGARSMQALPMPFLEQTEFAQQALQLRWPEGAPIGPGALLERKRTGDRGEDLWTTFNVVQENLIRGGARFTGTRAGRSIRAHVRPVRAVDDDRRINTALWQLAADWRTRLAA